VIAEIKLMHISNSILDEKGKIDQEKIDLVARLGGDWYCRVTKDSLFKVAKPNRNIGIGVDELPASIRNSNILTGNDLGQLGNVERLPAETSINLYVQEHPELQQILLNTRDNLLLRREAIHSLAKSLLVTSKVDEAWMVLLSDDDYNRET
jgi:hypothetical protein